MDTHNSKFLVEIEEKIGSYTILRNVIFYLFIMIMVVNIAIYFLFDYYLPLKYPVITNYILYAFLMAGILIQSYLYFLFKKIGRSFELLRERGLIFMAIIIVFIIGLTLLEM